MRKTNPIWPPPEDVGRGRPTYEELKRAKRTQFRPAQMADGGDCAKRSQTWGDWDMWEKAAVVWAVARPGSQTCKTNPIWGRGPLLRTEDCGLRIQRCRLRADAGGKTCKTNPIRLGRGRASKGKCAKRTQSGRRAREWARTGGRRCPA
jgi:hypothetical protein